MNYKSIINGLCNIGAILIPFFIGYYCHKDLPVEPIEVKVDTLVIHDTITCTEPIFVTKRVIDSVLVPVLDSVRVHDTTFVYLEREQVVWQDSLSMVYASGILPQVDSVRHFTTDRIVTIETTRIVKEKTHWGFGIQAGMGMGKSGFTPYVGVGVSYNILSW